MGDFKWDQQKEEAAAHCAVGELTNQEISDLLDIGIATLNRWKAFPEFKERIAEHVVAVREATMTQEIGDIVKRIRRLNKRWQQIDQLIAARSTASEMMNVAGGQTGLLAHEQKSIGSGELATVVDVYRFDAALIKEERELAKQAAQECGQWTDRVKHDFTNLSDEELKAKARGIVLDPGGTGSPSGDGT